MKTTKIEWTDKTWNPITGCTKYSTGCLHCYAEMMSRRLKAMGLKKYSNGFQLTLHEDDLDEPRFWKKSHNIFVCSMSDLFHENVPEWFIDKVIKTIIETPQHRYQILTKRAERMENYFLSHAVPENVWLGVTVESPEVKYRIDYLRKLPALVKFLSCEPLVEDLGEINLDGIDWVIVGGESGLQARPMSKEWVENIRTQVEQSGVAFFFKQWGTWGSDGVKRSKYANGKLLDGKIMQEMPNIQPWTLKIQSNCRQKLHFRQWYMSDEPVLRQLVEQVDNRLMDDTFPSDLSQIDICSWIVNMVDCLHEGDLHYAIELNDKVVGCLNLFHLSGAYGHTGQLHIVLFPDYCHQNIGTQVVRRVIEMAFSDREVARAKFEPRFESIVAYVVIDNLAAIKVLENNGFVRVGTLRNAVCRDATFFDQHVYCLNRLSLIVN